MNIESEIENGILQSLRLQTRRLLYDSKLSDTLTQIEAYTGVKREYWTYVIGGLLSVYLIYGNFAPLVCNLIGTAYPIYASIKAIESPDTEDDTRWLTYWSVFAVFSVADSCAEIVLSWMPLYWLAKCVFLLYLYLPGFNGAERLYRSHLRPFVLEYQPIIDQQLNNAQRLTAKALVDNVNEEDLSTPSINEPNFPKEEQIEKSDLLEQLIVSEQAEGVLLEQIIDLDKEVEVNDNLLPYSE